MRVSARKRTWSNVWGCLHVKQILSLLNLEATRIPHCQLSREPAAHDKLVHNSGGPCADHRVGDTACVLPRLAL